MRISDLARWVGAVTALVGFLNDARGAETGGVASVKPPRSLPEWKAMDYGPFISATLEVSKGNIANKGVAIRLDSGPGGVARGHEFFLFETDTLRAAAIWAGPEFIDWHNIAFDGAHEVHASIIGDPVITNPDAPGWADANDRFEDTRAVGRDGLHYGPLPRDWARWRGLYVHGDRVVLSYEVGGASVLESPGVEGSEDHRRLIRSFEIGARARSLTLQVGQSRTGFVDPVNAERPAQSSPVFMRVVSTNASPETVTRVALVGGPESLRWTAGPDGALRLRIPAGSGSLRFKLEFDPRHAGKPAPPREPISGLEDLAQFTQGGPARWTQTSTTRVERVLDPRPFYVVESITVPTDNPYKAWMRLGGFDFLKDGRRAAVCTWQGDVWLVDGLGGTFATFTWKRIAAGLFQPLGVKVVDDAIYVTCRDQITVLRDLNGDGETDFYENFNNDAQVTEHFHEFAMDLQTDSAGNFYYAKGGRHAKDALVPQHGTLLRVAKDGSKTDIVAYGFRAPNGFCLNGDGTYVVSDQEGHWTPENRINWVKPGGFYGYMWGYHEGRQPEDYEPPMVWVHKSLDRSPAEPLWVDSEKWGLPKGALIISSYGTGKLLLVLPERVGNQMQGGVISLPIAPAPTGIMRSRFHPVDGQLYTAGLFGWAGDRTKPGGFYRMRYTEKPVHLPVALHAMKQGMLISFSQPLDPDTASDRENYAVSRWTYNRTANYGSDDYKISKKGERGRDSVQVAGVRLAPDRKSVLLEIPGMQPCTQMEIKYNIRSADGARLAQLIQNTIHVVGGDAKLPDSK